MPTFTVTAHQEMFTEQEVDAGSAREAAAKFKKMVEAGKVEWRASDEDLEFEVSGEDEDVLLTADQYAEAVRWRSR